MATAEMDVVDPVPDQDLQTPVAPGPAPVSVKKRPPTHAEREAMVDAAVQTATTMVAAIAGVGSKVEILRSYFKLAAHDRPPADCAPVAVTGPWADVSGLRLDELPTGKTEVSPFAATFGTEKEAPGTRLALICAMAIERDDSKKRAVLEVVRERVSKVATLAPPPPARGGAGTLYFMVIGDCACYRVYTHLRDSSAVVTTPRPNVLYACRYGKDRLPKVGCVGQDGDKVQHATLVTVLLHHAEKEVKENGTAQAPKKSRKKKAAAATEPAETGEATAGAADVQKSPRKTPSGGGGGRDAASRIASVNVTGYTLPCALTKAAIAAWEQEHRVRNSGVPEYRAAVDWMWRPDAPDDKENRPYYWAIARNPQLAYGEPRYDRVMGLLRKYAEDEGKELSLHMLRVVYEMELSKKRKHPIFDNDDLGWVEYALSSANLSAHNLHYSARVSDTPARMFLQSVGHHWTYKVMSIAARFLARLVYTTLGHARDIQADDALEMSSKYAKDPARREALRRQRVESESATMGDMPLFEVLMVDMPQVSEYFRWLEASEDPETGQCGALEKLREMMSPFSQYAPLQDYPWHGYARLFCIWIRALHTMRYEMASMLASEPLGAWPPALDLLWEHSLRGGAMLLPGGSTDGAKVIAGNAIIKAAAAIKDARVQYQIENAKKKLAKEEAKMYTAPKTNGQKGPIDSFVISKKDKGKKDLVRVPETPEKKQARDEDEDEADGDGDDEKEPVDEEGDEEDERVPGTPPSPGDKRKKAPSAPKKKRLRKLVEDEADEDGDGDGTSGEEGGEDGEEEDPTLGGFIVEEASESERYSSEESASGNTKRGETQPNGLKFDQERRVWNLPTPAREEAVRKYKFDEAFALMGPARGYVEKHMPRAAFPVRVAFRFAEPNDGHMMLLQRAMKMDAARASRASVPWYFVIVAQNRLMIAPCQMEMTPQEPSQNDPDPPTKCRRHLAPAGTGPEGDIHHWAVVGLQNPKTADDLLAKPWSDPTVKPKWTEGVTGYVCF